MFIMTVANYHCLHILGILGIISRMYIALNWIGTAPYDPRPVVTTFSVAKQRRRKLPDPEVYQNPQYVNKFLSNDTNL